MPAKKGDHLGAVHDIESLRLRCVCLPDDDCWHLRTARGKPMPTDRRHCINVYGQGRMTVGRAVWHLLGKAVPPRCEIFRGCDSYDCANPAHIRCGLKSTRMRLLMRARGRTIAQQSALEIAATRARKITPELHAWIIESAQSTHEIAAALDVGRSQVTKWRRRPLPVSSVFAWRP